MMDPNKPSKNQTPIKLVVFLFLASSVVIGVVVSLKMYNALWP